MSFSNTFFQEAFSGLYSHNDELQTNPFNDANALNYAAMEVDVFLISGVLRVGHDSTSASSGPTLAAAYLDKIVALAHNLQPKRLAIDLKDNPSDSAFTALITLLNTYSDLADGHMQLTCTGFHPTSPTTHPSWVRFGRGRNLVAFADSEVTDIEIDFTTFSSWDGSAPVPGSVRENLLIYANDAHVLGKRLRIFFAPSTVASWQVQYDCGCDWIQPGGNHPPGADDIAGLHTYAVSKGWLV